MSKTTIMGLPARQAAIMFMASEYGQQIGHLTTSTLAERYLQAMCGTSTTPAQVGALVNEVCAIGSEVIATGRELQELLDVLRNPFQPMMRDMLTDNGFDWQEVWLHHVRGVVAVLTTPHARDASCEEGN